MKKTIIFLAIAVVCAFLGTASAAVKFISGDVTAVDSKAGIFTIKTFAGNVIKCEVTPKTEIRLGNESMSLNDVKVGDRVICKYEITEGKYICLTLIISYRKNESL